MLTALYNHICDKFVLLIREANVSYGVSQGANDKLS